MGWSCRREASEILKKWEAACRAQTGSQNVFRVGSREYFFEIDETEYNDGAVTGAISETTSTWSDGSVGTAVSAGTFRIEGDGRVTRAPQFLKDAAFGQCTYCTPDRYCDVCRADNRRMFVR